MKKIITIVITGIVLTSCKQKGDHTKYTHDPLLFSKTVKALNNVVLENNFPPMIASRNYAYASIAAFEVVAAGDASYQTLAGQIKHLPALPAADTVNVDFPFAAMLAFCKVGETVTFPEGSMSSYVAQLKKLADSAGMNSEVMVASQKFADHVADHILKWSKGDNYAQTRSAPRFTVLNEEGRWIPTPPMYGQAIEPHWNEIRPFVLDSASECRAAPHPLYNMKDTTSEFYSNLMEVKRIGESLTEEQKHIADFWDDNPFKMNVTGHVMYATKKFSPAGHWMNIVGIGASKANADFNTTVAAYAQTAIAFFDAFISCWDEKFRCNLVRPETVINNFDANWQPYIQTPPFPSYTSGHATISAAAAEVMTNWFGDTISFTDTSLLEFGIKNRHISSFREAAKEAAMSRLYGGIHYRFDNEEGNKVGRRVGECVLNRLHLKKGSQLTSNQKPKK